MAAKQKLITRAEYAQMMKDLRGLVSFNFKIPDIMAKRLDTRDLNKIEKYWSEINKLQARPNYVYRAKKKSNLKKAQKFAQHAPGFPDLKVAFIPTAGEKEKPRIKFDKKGNISVKGTNLESVLLPLDINKLARIQSKNEDETDTPNALKKEIEKTVDEFPDFDTYTVAAEKYEIRRPLNRARLPSFIWELMQRYSGEAKESAPGENHYWENWLHSVRAYKFINQSPNRYFKLKEENARKLQVKRKQERRRQKYKRMRDKL